MSLRISPLLKRSAGSSWERTKADGTGDFSSSDNWGFSRLDRTRFRRNIFLFLKFHEGGWLTILVTSSVIMFDFTVKRHYIKTHRAIKGIDFKLIIPGGKKTGKFMVHGPDKAEDTAIILVNGFTNIGLHTLFMGQIVFPKETFFFRLLHNYAAFAVQKRLYKKGIPVVILPIKP